MANLRQLSFENILRIIFIFSSFSLVVLFAMDVDRLIANFNDNSIKEKIIYLRILSIKASFYLLMFCPFFKLLKILDNRKFLLKFANIKSSFNFAFLQKNYIPFLLLSFLMLPLLLRMSGIGFLGDFYYDIIKSSKGITHIFKSAAWEGGHYSPLYYIIIYLEYLLFDSNVFYYHLIQIFIHNVNAYFVYYIASVLTKNKLLSLISGLIFATYFTVYGNIIMVTYIQSSLMTTFYLSSFIFFIKYLNEHETKYYILFSTMLAISILFQEAAYTILIVSIMYEIFLVGGFKNWKFRKLIKFVIPFLFILIHFSLLKDIEEYPLVNIFTMIKTILASLGYLFSMNNIDMAYLITRLIYFRIPNILIFILAFMIFVAWLKIFNNFMKFIFAACLLTLAPPLLFRHVPDILRMGSYLYLSTAFFSIFLAYTFFKSRKIILEYYKETSNKKSLIAERFAVDFFFGSIISIMIIAGLSFQKEAINQYLKANEIKNNILADTKKIIPNMEGKKVYYLNIPAYIYNNRVKAELFRRGLKEALFLTYRGKIGQFYTNLDQKDLFSLIELRGFEKNDSHIILIYDPILNSVKIDNDD